MFECARVRARAHTHTHTHTHKEYKNIYIDQRPSLTIISDRIFPDINPGIKKDLPQSLL